MHLAQKHARSLLADINAKRIKDVTSSVAGKQR
jgi:hypothetical protein